MLALSTDLRSVLTDLCLHPISWGEKRAAPYSGDVLGTFWTLLTPFMYLPHRVQSLLAISTHAI